MVFSEEMLTRVKTASKIAKTSPGPPTIQKGSKQWNLDIEFAEENFLDMSFKVFVRQNMNDLENFSCGIQMVQVGKRTMLSRYNGSNHENNVAKYECHIHNATPESINKEDRNPEHADTRVTDRYNDVESAFKCLCEDYNIKLSPSRQSDLFGDMLLQ